MSQRPNTKSTSGILSVGAVGAAGPHVVLEPGGLRALVGWAPRIPEPQTDTATHLQVAYFLLVLSGLLVPMWSSNLGASSPGGWPHDFKKQPGTPNNCCLLMFLLCPQDLGATQAPQQIHRWHMFSRCVCSSWPLVFLIKPEGTLGGWASRLQEATGHTTKTTGYFFPIGAPDCQHTAHHTAHNHNTTPHTTTTPQHTHTHNNKTTKPQHTTHSTTHNHNTTPHTTATPQHHNTTAHTTTQPQHTAHNTTHSTQNTSTQQHNHTAHTQHRRRRKRRSGQTLNPGHQPRNWQEGTTTHTHSTQHTAQHKEHNTAPHTANASMGPPWVKLRHRVGWSRSMGGTKGLGFPLLAQQD